MAIAMKNNGAKSILQNMSLWNMLNGDEYNALKMGISALEKIGYLKDRPCEACKFHKENGCSSWDCVFEK